MRDEFATRTDGDMARRQWTLLVISDDETRCRQFEVSRQLVQIGIAAILVVSSVITSFAVGFFVKESHRVRAEQLEVRNALLLEEVGKIRERYETLKEAVEALAGRDAHYRLLAGLEPLDPEVLRAGIGGPGTETLESNELWLEDRELGAITFATAADIDALIRRARLLAESWREATDSLTANHDRLRSTPSIPPTMGYLSSGFSRSRMHPLLDTERAHQGIDISAPRGTPVIATADGRVISASRRGNYGLMIEIDHGYGYVSRYAHTSIAYVKPGDWVTRGDTIAEVGSTGLAAGPHLHYEVLVNGRPVNPLDYMLVGEVLTY